MKAGAMLIILLLCSISYSSELNVEESLVVYYFGATNCGYSNIPENIENIKIIKTAFTKKYSDTKIKYVMVCFDNDIEQGLKYIDKYGFWDEISIGQRYYNDLSLIVLNVTEIPGVPHIIVFRDTYESSERIESIPVIKDRVLLVDLVGGTQINEWIEEGYPLN